MQDPSQGVDPRLLPHLHLLLIPQAPKQHRLTNNAVVDWLQKVPQLVKERPVSWQFIGPQENGTMFFEWLHPGRTDKFPSDGYAWLDVEHSFQRDISEQYVLDILISYCGVLPDGPSSAFMRTRYRVRSKVNAPGPFDPSFWLVHYAAADPQYQNMVQQGYQLRPEVVHIFNERRVLQSQGLPQRKDFMLVDRMSWPQVHYPSMARGGPPYAGRPGPGQHAPGQPPYAYTAANAHNAGPPAKRARQTGPAQVAPGAMPAPPVALYHDAELELIEDVSSGDYLDNISPAQISRDRYKRHHLWLEEVFSSMHSPGQILPEDLGFGLVGELGELTKGLLNPPVKKNWADQERKNPESFFQDPQINASSVYKHLDSEQFADFERRVAAFVDAKNKEMDEMREEHARMISKMSKGKYYVDAEERLREAGADSYKVGSIVSEVENKMGISMIERHDVVCVERGGLVDEEPDDIIDEPMPEESAVINGHDELAAQTNGATEEAAMDVTSTEPIQPQVPEPPAEVAAETADAAVDAGVDAGVDLQDGMDIDVPSAPVLSETVAASVQPVTAEPTVSAASEIPAVAPEPSTIQPDIVAPADITEPTQPAAAQEEAVQPPAQPSAPTEGHPPAQAEPLAVSEPIASNEPEPDDVMGGGEPESMFDEATYGDFDDGIEGEFAAAEAAAGDVDGLDGGDNNDNGAGGAGDDGLLDFSGDYGQSAGTGTTPTQTS